MLNGVKKNVAGIISNELVPLCRFCGGDSCISIGKIEDSDMFAGQIVVKPIPGGHLWHCHTCDSLFRYPVLEEDEYLSLYESVDSEIWEDDALRKDQILAISAIKSVIQTGKILDVGCYAGQLLAALPYYFEKFGVEPSQAAAAKAKNKGIKVLGATITDIPADMKFDCIVSIDVIEHLINPIDFFNKAFQLLNPKGFLIISTGNPNSFAWQCIFKSHFWYVTNAEHVSFPSQKLITIKAQGLGGEVVNITNFRYANIGFKRSLIKLFGQCVYALSPKLYSTMRGIRGDGSRYPSIYSLGLFKDHHLIVIRKKN